MDIEGFRKYCLAKDAVTEEFPFDENTLVYKVKGKMFALTDINEFQSINLKVDPEKSTELQEQYPSVRPGYHMNKKHWMTVLIDGSVSDKLLLQWIDDSYALVVQTLPKRLRA